MNRPSSLRLGLRGLRTLLPLVVLLVCCGQTKPAEPLARKPTKREPAAERDLATSESFLLYGYDEEPYKLPPGPHLFVDYRYINAGRTNYVFPDGAEAGADGGDSQRVGSIIGLPDTPPSNVRIEAQKAEKLGIVLSNDQPWEWFMHNLSLLRSDGKYRLWYEVAPLDESKMGESLCYAESEDGVKWTKPKLGLIEFGGSKENNIVYSPPPQRHLSFHGASVFVDPIAAPEQRFKVIYMCDASLEEIAKFKAVHPASVSPIGQHKMLFIRLATSPDGLHWTPRVQPLMSHMSDTQTTVYYDEVLKRYVGFFRLNYMDHRAIGRTESPNLEPWPIPKVALFPEPMHDGPGDDYYISGYSRYPGTTTMHLMISTIFKRHTDSTELSLASSMDGEHWTWIPGGPVLQPGADGSWDGGCIFAGINLTELPDGRVVFPYRGFIYPHKFPRKYTPHLGNIGLAGWPKERLSAIIADEDGAFTTRPLSGQGTQLFVNFQTKRGGYVKVSIQGDRKHPVSNRTIELCDSLFGDQTKKQVTWKGEGASGVKPGEAFTLHFELRAAKLYSFEIR